MRLSIQAFGPYPHCEVIDFREAVEAGIFGIYGPTGSGKSTIFSAMAFALFGRPAKEDQDASSVRSDHADAGIQTEVEFVFDIGARRFVILRRPEQMRPKHKGDGETRSPHEAYLFDASGLALDDIREGQRGKIIAEKKVGIVDAAISEILGYGPEQFRQIVLLPQGRFETFLSAKTKERLDILRDLFDVSIYRSFSAKLKDEAEAAERLVRQERELCARRLTVEGFESTDALAAGIVEADARHVELLETEKIVRQIFMATQSDLQLAAKVDAQFRAAEDAQSALVLLQGGKAAINSLADQVAKADRARLLLDPENQVNTTAGEVRDADAQLIQIREAYETASARAKSADETWTMEIERAGEIDDLRKQVDELSRFQQTLEIASDKSATVNEAQAAELKATEQFSAASLRLTGIQDNMRRKSEALKAARQTEKRRQDLLTQLANLRSALGAAETFEKADLSVQTAQRDLDARTSTYDVAARRAGSARVAFEVAEQALTHVQALHLASKLSSGDPCPVCGAIEHPAPATGTVEHAGLEQAFRTAKADWQKADDTARSAEENLIVARSVLEERQNRLESLGRPEDRAAAIRARENALLVELETLGPDTDLTIVETEIERLADEIVTLETPRDLLRDELAALERQTVAKKAQLDEVLSVIPQHLRDKGDLSAAEEAASRSLAERQEVRAAAERTATETRESALGALKDLQAAEKALNICNSRLASVTEHFQSRLREAGLLEEGYQALKPAIATIEKDRERIEDFRRKLGAAEQATKNAADSVGDQTRPDMKALERGRSEAEDKLTKATNLRAGSGHRLEHLTKLRGDLDETLRKLGEAEAASGPLRHLAALTNGENSQKLDLETFAIGAMFDQVLEAANLRLGPMTVNRYQLERDLEGAGRGRRGLGIQVYDVFTGRARPTTTLSGGETFISALALALGLADVVESASGKVRLDTIFIDEGFGSLDTENGSGTLDQVLQVLGSLVSQNRAVGLISHVPLVQEAIPNGFYVRKQLAGSSVETRGVA